MERMRDIIYREGYEAGKRDAVGHAFWIGHMNDDALVMPGEWMCSHCEGKEKKKSDYCPNCGYRMDEEV